MICPKCSIAPDDYVTGEWIHKRINGHPRRVCRTCGYVDERKCWVSGVYCGPPEKNPEKISDLNSRELKHEAGSLERKTSWLLKKNK